MYKHFRPGKTWYDTEGKPIQAHAGAILFAEGKFWWYGENKEGITGRAQGERCKYQHHGIRCYSSTDLYNWKDEGTIVPESDDESNPFHPTIIAERPHILYNEKTKKYVLWAKSARNGYKNGSFAVCVGDTLHALRYIGDANSTPHCVGDFDLFIDGGKAYAVFENPHSEMILRELNEDYTDFAETWTSHLPMEGPPMTREAPAYFVRNGRKFLITSGTTGYFPNPTIGYDVTDLHGEWKDLGLTCRNDVKRNSFHAQFSSVFKHPTIPDLYIALGDRWLTDLPEDLPDMEQVFHDMFFPTQHPLLARGEMWTLTDENTSMAAYVWLPIMFDENGLPYIVWRRTWTVEEFEKK